jgi:predicted transcriptional regulator
MTDQSIDHRPDGVELRRRALGWSQEKLAVLAGIGSATVRRIERGTVTPHPLTVQAVEQTLTAAEKRTTRDVGASGPSATPSDLAKAVHDGS